MTRYLPIGNCNSCYWKVRTQYNYACSHPDIKKKYGVKESFKDYSPLPELDEQLNFLENCPLPTLSVDEIAHKVLDELMKLKEEPNV